MVHEPELPHIEEFPIEPGTELPGKLWIGRGRRIVHLVTGFAIGQGAAQALMLLAGIFLVRHLSTESYAQLGIAIGFQTMFTTLMDLGIAATVVPLVGDRRDDRALVGRYVRAAKHLRDRSFYVLAPVAAVGFFALVHRHHWPMALQLTLLLSTLVTLYSSGKVSYFSAVLFLHGRLRSYYALQVLTGALRLGSYAVLAFAGWLNAWVAAAIAAAAILFTAEQYGEKARRLMDWPQHDDPATDREVFRYILPAAPAMIFAAFQAQLTLFLISIFGGKTAYIAQVAALGRIGQVFTVLTTFNLIVVEPFVARLNRQRLLSTYLLFTGVACAALSPVVYAAFRWPGAFLWLIGPKYSDLHGVLGWVILAATINYLASLLWLMNRGRKWLFWSGSLVEIGLLMTVQLALIIMVGVRTTYDAVMLTLAASVCMLLAHLYVAVLGFSGKERKRAGSPVNPAAA
ncbi:MAG: hypothetical protein INR62_07105 [Rhodospirillales bacterium]|nr:hypothetical protein [Acetobacter sp.]